MFKWTDGVVGATVLVVTMSVTVAVSAQGDDPDLRKEALFHRYFKSFNENPTPDDKWQSAITQGAAQTYTIQSGDTLWGLSETLFADPNFWPKVWSLNVEQIGNPHEILPDQTVQFIPGTTGEAPSLAVTEEGASEEAVATEQTNATTEAPAEPEKKEFDLSSVTLPEPSRKSGPVAKFPASIPGWQFRKDNKDSAIFEVEKINRDFGAPENQLTNFVVEMESAAMGTIKETEMGLGSAAEFQYIIVQLPTAPAEKNLLVIREKEKIVDPVTDEEGMVVQVQGEIQILESVNTEENLYRAMVRRVINPVEVGAKLVSGSLPTYNTQEEGSGTGNAQIIGGQHGEKRVLFSDQAVVYLNGGSKAGLTVGQSYPIYKQPTLRVEKTNAIQNPRMIGRVKVLRVTDYFATGVITQASEDVRAGDTTSPARIE